MKDPLDYEEKSTHKDKNYTAESKRNFRSTARTLAFIGVIILLEISIGLPLWIGSSLLILSFLLLLFFLTNGIIYTIIAYRKNGRN